MVAKYLFFCNGNWVNYSKIKQMVTFHFEWSAYVGKSSVPINDWKTSTVWVHWFKTMLAFCNGNPIVVLTKIDIIQCHFSFLRKISEGHRKRETPYSEFPFSLVKWSLRHEHQPWRFTILQLETLWDFPTNQLEPKVLTRSVKEILLSKATEPEFTKRV